MHTYVQKYIHSYIHTYIHTYIYTYIHTYIYAYLPTRSYVHTFMFAAGISVWLDKVCLQPGEPWEEGFCRGMAMSRIFIPVLSRSAIKNYSNARNNFELLREDSQCDNVILGTTLYFITYYL